MSKKGLTKISLSYSSLPDEISILGNPHLIIFVKIYYFKLFYNLLRLPPIMYIVEYYGGLLYNNSQQRKLLTESLCYTQIHTHHTV